MTTTHDPVRKALAEECKRLAEKLNVRYLDLCQRHTEETLHDFNVFRGALHAAIDRLVTPAVQGVDKTVPWPAVDAYSGNGSSGDVAAWLKVRLGDGPETTEFIRKDLVRVEERQPLTEEQLFRLIEQSGAPYTEPVQQENRFTGEEETVYIQTTAFSEFKFARLVERAHGIKSPASDGGAKSHGSPKA